MSLVDEVRKLEPADFALAVGVFIAIVAPGFLTIYLYKPELVSSLDTFKLLVFSSAITLPVVVANFAAAAYLANEDSPPNFADISMQALASGCVVLYISLILSYLLTLTFRFHLGVLAFIEVLFFLAAYLGNRKKIA